MSAHRDGNVYQVLLRELRSATLAAMGEGKRDASKTDLEALVGVLAQVSIELDLVSQVLDSRDEGDSLGFLVRSLRTRLNFASELVLDSYCDPDRPYETSSAVDFLSHEGDRS